MTKKNKIKMISNKKRRRRYNKKRYMLYYIFFGIIAMITISILCLTVFFNIEFIEIDNNSNYKNETIIKASKIKQGDNLILTNTDIAEKNVFDSLVNIDKVSIYKKFPDTIHFKCESAIIDFAIEIKKGIYILISKYGRILKRKNNKIPPKKTFTLKLEEENFKNLKEGNFFKIPEAYELTFETIKNIINKKNIKNITYIYIKRNKTVFITFENRILLKIEDIEKAEHLIDSSVLIIKNHIGANETGKILYLPSKKTIHFIPSN